jgi:hypothetical protein
MDERRVELQHALFRRVLPHIRLCDTASAVVQRIAEHIVETAHTHSLTSSVIRKLQNSGTNINVIHLLPKALAALSRLLGDVTRTLGQSTAVPVPLPRAAAVVSRSSLFSPTVDRSTSAEYLKSLTDLHLDELQMFATRLRQLPSARRHGQLVQRLHTEALRVAALQPELHVLPDVICAASLAPLPRFALSAFCRRAGLPTDGGVDTLRQRLITAANRSPPTAEELEAAALSVRAQRQWHTPLFDLLGARQLPFSYGVAAHPPLLGVVFCSSLTCPNRAADTPTVLCGCGCAYHTQCRPALGFCFCASVYARRVREAANGRNALVEKRVAGLRRRFTDLDRSLDSGDDLSADEFDDLDVVPVDLKHGNDVDDASNDIDDDGDDVDELGGVDGGFADDDDLGAADVAAAKLAPVAALKRLEESLREENKKCAEL